MCTTPEKVGNKKIPKRDIHGSCWEEELDKISGSTQKQKEKC